MERLLNEREKLTVLRKLNMVIGASFGEAGNRLIKMLGGACAAFSTLEASLAVAQDWVRDNYEAASESYTSGQAGGLENQWPIKAKRSFSGMCPDAARSLKANNHIRGR